MQITLNLRGYCLEQKEHSWAHACDGLGLSFQNNHLMQKCCKSNTFHIFLSEGFTLVEPLLEKTSLLAENAFGLLVPFTIFLIIVLVMILVVIITLFSFLVTICAITLQHTSGFSTNHINCLAPNFAITCHSF